MDPFAQQILDDIRAGRTAALAGTRVSADLAASDALLNAAIAQKIPPNGPLKSLQVRSAEGHARVTVRVTRPSFLPPITLTLTVDRQPELPGSPVLVLRIGMMPGIAMLLGAGLGFLNVLPPGLRIDGERLFVDLAAVARDRDLAWALPYVRALQVVFRDGRVVVPVALEL